MTKSTKAGPGKPAVAYEHNSRKIKARLEKDGWSVVRTNGDHHVMKHPKRKGSIVLCHPVKDLPAGTVRQIYKQAGWQS